MSGARAAFSPPGFSSSQKQGQGQQAQSQGLDPQSILGMARALSKKTSSTPGGAGGSGGANGMASFSDMFATKARQIESSLVPEDDDEL